MKAFMFCVALGMLVGCVENYRAENAEFVCYADDKLSERHVGVANAYRDSSEAWIITYKEGNDMVYVQQRGEACTVEVVK